MGRYEKYDFHDGGEMSESLDDTNSLVEKMFFGAVTVGERGQVVIPAEARKTIGIDTGDKLIVFMHPSRDGIAFLKIGAVEQFIEILRETIHRANHAPAESESEE
jgi:AbrB family looped-hinge helix DNA binding protein